jgi:hypothetical protein
MKQGKTITSLCLVLFILATARLFTKDAVINSSDAQLKVRVSVRKGTPVYSVSYKNKIVPEDSPL